jgi:hypothetical protein
LNLVEPFLDAHEGALQGSAPSAVLMLLSGWLYAHFGPAGFWAMGAFCTAAFPVIWLLHRALAALAAVPKRHSCFP